MQHIILSSPSCTLPLSLSPNFLSHVAENSIKAVFPLAAVSMTAHTDTMNETLSLLSSIPQSTGEQLAQIYHHQHRTKARCVSRISLQIQNCRQVNHTVSEVAKMQSSPCVQKENGIYIYFYIACNFDFPFFGGSVWDKDKRAEYGLHGTGLLLGVLKLKMSTQWSDCRSPSKCTHPLFVHQTWMQHVRSLQMMPHWTDRFKSVEALNRIM